jgi:hypothetical protein
MPHIHNTLPKPDAQFPAQAGIINEQYRMSASAHQPGLWRGAISAITG